MSSYSIFLDCADELPLTHTLFVRWAAVDRHGICTLPNSLPSHFGAAAWWNFSTFLRANGSDKIWISILLHNKLLIYCFYFYCCCLWCGLLGNHSPIFGVNILWCLVGLLEKRKHSIVFFEFSCFLILRHTLFNVQSVCTTINYILRITNGSLNEKCSLWWRLDRSCSWTIFCVVKVCWNCHFDCIETIESIISCILIEWFRIKWTQSTSQRSRYIEHT